MKVQATKAVKNEGTAQIIEAERAENEDPAHETKWRSDVKRECRKVFSEHEQSIFPTWKHLYESVCKRFGQWLPEYLMTENRRQNLENIIINVLVDATKKRDSQNERTES